MKFAGLAMNDLDFFKKKQRESLSNKRIKISPCVKYPAFGFSETTPTKWI